MIKIEFYIIGQDGYTAVCKAGAVPRVNELIRIGIAMYKVNDVVWIIDYPEDCIRTSLVANVLIDRYKK